MITYVVSDLFLSPAPVLVNTVNTVGAMGKGIAKEFKRIFPEMFREYQSLCERGLLQVGMLHLYKTPNKWILNFPTKRHWRQPSQLDFIRAGLSKFVQTHHQYGITSVSFPQLGCGNGELDWDLQVRPTMEEFLDPLPISVFVHLADSQDPFTPEHRNIAAIRKWLRSEPESLAFDEVWHELGEHLAENQNFQTLNSAECFSARLDREAMDIIINTSSTEYRITNEALIELWQLVRQSGFVSALNMPSGLSGVCDQLVTLLTRLPYVEPVTITDRYDSIGFHPLGLRLQPRERAVQPPLFAVAGAVEPA